MRAAVLVDDVGVVDFTLVKGANKTIRADFTTTADLTLWTFEAALYIGESRTRTVVLSSSSGITLNSVDKYLTMVWSAASISAITVGYIPWDLRYTAGTDVGQLLKGTLTLGVV